MRKIITSLIILLLTGWSGINAVNAQARLFGVTPGGGANGGGVIYEWNPTTDTYTKIFDFGGSNGQVPKTSLSLYDDKFYGMTAGGGGPYSNGVIYEWDPATTTYTVKFAFYPGSNGINPKGDLAFHEGKFYGVCEQGGTYAGGVIFEWDPVTNTYTKKVELNAASGYKPTGGLTLYNSKFYGLAEYGGTNDYGVIFEWDPETNIYTKKFDFYYDEDEDFDTGIPLGSLVLNGNKFFGITRYGGIYYEGLLFEWDPVTNIFTPKHSFEYSDGTEPRVQPVAHEGKLYGVTTAGGNFECGGIYEYDPVTNIYVNKHDIDCDNGAAAACSMTMSGGKFYGHTQAGGENELGVLFTWDPVTNIFTKEYDFVQVSGFGPFQTSMLEYTPSDADNDGDGFSVADGDCNDSNPDIYPGATELCNGIDDNCNDTIDEGLVHSISASHISYTPDDQDYCEGTTVMLTVVGGTLGTGAEWVWYEGGCGNGEPIATGDTIYVTPPAGYHYYYARAEGACNVTDCRLVNLDFYSPPTAWILGPEEVNANDTAYFETAYAQDFIWNVSEGGVVISGGGPDDYWIEVTWPTPGLESVSVNWSNSVCHAPEPAVIEVTVLDPAPHPDLAVSGVQSLSGNIVPGSDLTVGWIVENIGDSVAAG